MKRLKILIFIIFIFLISCDRYAFMPGEYDTGHGHSGSSKNIYDVLPGENIQDAINYADTIGYPEIHLAVGTHYISDQINMIDGISLLGGYNSNFTVRDPSLYPATIQDTRTGTGNNYVIYCNNIGNSTSIDGLIIRADSGTNIVTVYCNDSSVVISNNDIYAGSGASTCGIFLFESNAAVISNTIDGGVSTGWAYGILSRTDTANPDLINNFIYSGDGANAAGIYLNFNSTGGSTVVIVNNTIVVGSSGAINSAVVIANQHPIIRNNIFYHTISGVGTSVYGDSGGNDWAGSLANNCFFNQAVYIRYSAADYASIVNTIYTEYDGTDTIENFGNINIDPLLVNTLASDYRIQAASPLDVRGGGSDESIHTTVDFFGVTRTTGTPAGAANTNAAGWSMGAHEFD